MRYIITAIPFIWSIFCLPFVNTAHPFVLGIPFLAFWELTGIIISVIALQLLWNIDHKPGGIASKDHLYMDPNIPKEDIK